MRAGVGERVDIAFRFDAQKFPHHSVFEYVAIIHGDEAEGWKCKTANKSETVFRVLASNR